MRFCDLATIPVIVCSSHIGLADENPNDQNICLSYQFGLDNPESSPWIREMYEFLIRNFCACSDSESLRALAKLDLDVSKRSKLDEWKILSNSLVHPACRIFAKRLARRHVRNNRVYFENWYWFDPQSQLEALQNPERRLDNAAYDALVQVANTFIVERLRTQGFSENADVSLFQKFVSYYSDPRRRTAINTQAGNLVCEVLVAQKVYKSDQLCASSIESKCPSSGFPFYPWVTDDARKGDYDRLLLEDCVHSYNVEQIDKDARRCEFNFLAVIQAENKLRPGKGSDEEQLQIEKSQMIEICSEVIFLYSSFGRNPRTEFSGRSVPGCKDCWRRFSYPRKVNRIPFLFYQGMNLICNNLLYFSRKSAGSSVNKGTPATYPQKHEVYNMVAAFVEDVTDMPLGSGDFRAKYNQELLAVLLPVACTILKSNDFKACGTTDAPHSIIVAAFEIPMNNAAIGIHLDFEQIQNIWGFIFRHGGHSGLIALLVASLLTVFTIPSTEDYPQDRIVLQLIDSLHTLGKVDEMMGAAERLVRSPNWKTVVDEAEKLAIENTRPEENPSGWKLIRQTQFYAGHDRTIHNLEYPSHSQINPDQ